MAPKDLQAVPGVLRSRALRTRDAAALVRVRVLGCTHVHATEEAKAHKARRLSSGGIGLREKQCLHHLRRVRLGRRRSRAAVIDL